MERRIAGPYGDFFEGCASVQGPDVRRPERPDVRRPERPDVQRPERPDVQRPERPDVQRPGGGRRIMVTESVARRKEENWVRLCRETRERGPKVFSPKLMAERLGDLECSLLEVFPYDAEDSDSDEDAYLEYVMYEIAEKITDLTRAVELTDVGAIEGAVRVIVDGELDRLLRVRMGVDMQLSDDETHEEDLELVGVIREVKKVALKALCLSPLSECEAYDVWMRRVTTPGSERRAVLGHMRQGFVGREFLSAGIADECGFVQDSVQKSLAELRKKTSGTEFEVCSRRKGGKFLYRIDPAGFECDDIDERLLPGKKFAADLVVSNKSSMARPILDTVTDSPLRTRIDYDELFPLVAASVDKESFSRNDFGADVSAMILQIERAWGAKIREATVGKPYDEALEVLKAEAASCLTLRRIRVVDNTRMGGYRVSVELVNRLEAMEEWISEMAGRGTWLEKVLWLMFMDGLGKGYTKFDLSDEFRERGVEVDDVAMKRTMIYGSRGGNKVSAASRGSLFALEEKRVRTDRLNADGAVINAMSYRIRP